MRAYRSSELLRSLTLLRTFLIVSAVILAVGAVALSSRLSTDLRDAALDDSAQDVSAYADAVLGSALVHGNAVTATPRVRRSLTRSERLPPDCAGSTSTDATGVSCSRPRARIASGAGARIPT